LLLQKKALTSACQVPEAERNRAERSATRIASESGGPNKKQFSYTATANYTGRMTHILARPPVVLLKGSALAFTPVPQERRRTYGWSVVQQERFILALEAMGSVGPAAKAVGMGRSSAYRLRERDGAESFAQAWDRAIEMGRQRMFDYAIDRAMNGVTTVRVLRGGSISVACGPDMKLVQSAFRDTTPPVLKATKATVSV
jgi:hypothetical protein